MKKQIFLFCICFLAISCEHEAEVKSSAEMESFYKESCSWQEISSDSLKRFCSKVRTFIANNADAKNDPLLPKIQGNVDAYAQHFSVELNTEWDGETHITF